MKRGCRKNGKFLQLVSGIEKLDKKFRGLGMVLATGTLEGLWYETSDSGSQQDGVWRKHTALTIGLQIGWAEERAEEIVKLLVKCGFVDEDGDCLRVHDWLDHAPRFVQDSVRKRRTRGGHAADIRTEDGRKADGKRTEGGSDSGTTADNTRDGCACLSLSLSQGLSQGLCLSGEGEGGEISIWAYALRELLSTGKFPALTEEAVVSGLRCVVGHEAWGRMAAVAVDELVVRAGSMPGVIGAPVPWISKNLMAILDEMVGLGAKKNRGAPRAERPEASGLAAALPVGCSPGKLMGEGEG